MPNVDCHCQRKWAQPFTFINRISRMTKTFAWDFGPVNYFSSKPIVILSTIKFNLSVALKKVSSDRVPNDNLKNSDFYCSSLFVFIYLHVYSFWLFVLFHIHFSFFVFFFCKLCDLLKYFFVSKNTTMTMGNLSET